MTTKDFSDFKISLNLNLEVDVKMRKIAEFVKIVSAHSRTNPDHLKYVCQFLDGTIDDLTTYINDSVLDDGSEN